MKFARTIAGLLTQGAILVACFGCNTGEPLYIGSHGAAIPAECALAPSAPPTALGLDAFYGKFLDVKGIPIVSSTAVDDRALAMACSIVVLALPVSSEVLAAMVERRLRVAVIGRDEVTSDIPEYRDLYQVWPDTDWDKLRGVGATLARPVSSVGEENLLCTLPDPFPGEAVLFNSYSHGLRVLGIEPTDDSFDARLEQVFDEAKAAGLWANTGAGIASKYYFAEGMQDWFDANAEDMTSDGLGNSVNTRDELRAYDPGLSSLLGEYLSNGSWKWACP